MIAIVDYGRGNLFSLGQALLHLGAEHEITADPARIAAARTVMLPGVGAFGDAMSALRSLGLVEPLRAVAAAGTPLLGICLGMQLLATRSDEFGDHAGLDIIPGAVRRLPDGSGEDRVRIPNVGWRTLRPSGEMMYFVHSYAPFPDDPAHVVETIDVNGVAVPVMIRKGNVVGCQFHPEKSGPVGLALLARLL